MPQGLVHAVCSNNNKHTTPQCRGGSQRRVQPWRLGIRPHVTHGTGHVTERHKRHTDNYVVLAWAARFVLWVSSYSMHVCKHACASHPLTCAHATMYMFGACRLFPSRCFVHYIVTGMEPPAIKMTLMQRKQRRRGICMKCGLPARTVLTCVCFVPHAAPSNPSILTRIMSSATNGEPCSLVLCQSPTHALVPTVRANRRSLPVCMRSCSAPGADDGFCTGSTLQY
jgi:hypothetical protein